MVSMLTLPTNIIPMITSLLGSLSCAVSPTLKPTVLYAEKHSNAMPRRSLSLSKKAIMKTPVPITTSESEIMANERLTVMSAISLLKISMRDFPLAKLQKLRVAIANVLVFMPPPVEAGDAPTHMSKKINIKVEKLIAEVSTVLNPAVLGVAAPNMAVITLPKPLCSAKVLSYSKMKNTIEPKTNKVKLVIKVILELKLITHGVTVFSFPCCNKKGNSRLENK